MANLKSNDYKNIQLENVQAEFGKTKAYPADLLMPEVQDAWVYVYENGTAELSFKVRTDMEPTTGAMNSPFEGATGFYVETEIVRQELLDCIQHGATLVDFDVVGGSIWADVSTPTLEDSSATTYCKIDLSESTVQKAINDQAPAIVRSYICLFGADAIAQARAIFIEESAKDFKPAIEALLIEQGFAVAA